MQELVIPSGLIKREMYLKAIEPYIGQPLIKVLVGLRRAGKSYVLYQLIEKIKLTDAAFHIIYINKEDMAFNFIRNAEDLYGYVLSESKEGCRNFIFIDEIQEIDSFEKALGSLLLKENFDIYCTGSNARLLSGELATLLTGRFIEIRIHSLSYLEFLQFHQVNNSSDSLMLYLRYGGMPYLHRLGQDEGMIFEYLNNLVSTILYKDVVMRYGIRNTRFLDQLVRFLADTSGSIFSSKSISDFLKSQHIKLAPNQVQTYASYLCNSYLIENSERFDIVGKRIFEFGDKYYFEDTGLRNAIVGYKTSDINKLIENAIFKHLRIHGYQVSTGQVGNLEVDFIGEKQNEKIYIQAVYLLNSPETISREFGNLQKIDDNYPKMVVSMDQSGNTTTEGIKHLNLKDFLSQTSYS